MKVGIRYSCNLTHYFRFLKTHVQNSLVNAKGKSKGKVYKSMAARPRIPAPTTGAAVLTAKPLDEDDDALSFPVAAAEPLVLLEAEGLLL